MKDAELHRFGTLGPGNARIAEALWPFNPGYRARIMETAREIGGEKYGGWVNIVVLTAAAAQAGAELGTFREILAGRRWATRPGARHSGVSEEIENGGDSHW
jgi:hypothetical protein